MNDANLDDLRQRIDAFPAMPGNTTRVLEVLRNPNAGADAIEKVVGIDPGLTANVLRFANSAFVGLRGTVGSLRDAVVQLGVGRLSEMAVAGSVNTMMSSGVEGYSIDAGEMWRHAVAVGVGSEILARDLGLTMAGDCFTAGLLHDVGKLICGQLVGERWRELKTAASANATFDAAERGVIGMDHAEIGAEVLQHWGLPEALVLAVRCHHRPEGADGHPAQPLVDVVHVADAVALMLGLGAGREGLGYQVSDDVVQRLDLDERKLESFAARVVVGAEEILQVIETF